ncbi:MAG: hypothetical protein WC374_01635 [Phycisphaerae bacterium]|jgi:hypothetical protein
MRSIWAVAANTIRQALRMKIAAAFILLMVILIPVMGLGVTGDGTIKGKLQSFTTYSLALVSLLLSLLTIIVAAYSLSDDIKQHRIFMVLTKPIRRYKLLVGKLLGVILLDLILLVPICGVIYGITLYIPKHSNATPEQMQTLRNEFFTARASVKPPQPDVTDEVMKTYQELKSQNQLPERMSYNEIIANLTQLKKLQSRALPPGGEIRWQFDNIRLSESEPNIFIRYKYDVSSNPPDLSIVSGWMVGDLRQLPMVPQGKGSIYTFNKKDLIRTFHELEVNGNAVAADGHLEVLFYNPPVNNTVVIFDPDEGVEILYKAESFTTNFIKAASMIFARLVFLACVGVFAASFLSFPVAVLFAMTIFFITTISGFFLEAVGFLSTDVGTIYHYTVAPLVRLVPRFDIYNPSHYLVPARQIGWMLLAKMFVLLICLQSLIIFLFSLVIFELREIAKITV